MPLDKPMTVEEIREACEDGCIVVTVRLTWEEIIWEDPAGIDDLISERVCGDPGLLCAIKHKLLEAGGEGRDMYVDITVSADPRLLLRTDKI